MTNRLPLLALLCVLAIPAVCAAEGADAAPVVWVDTADGYQLALQHHENPGRPPVVLCHGISSNHHFWDLAPGRSLALYLQEQGYDVWNMDLRGHGPAMRDRDGKRQRPGWTIDDYGTHDLPAAFAHVLEQTGAERLHYVGHSLGGMVLAVYLARTPDPPLASAVVVGSPMDFRDPDFTARTMLGQSWMATLSGYTPTPAGARLLAGMGERVPFSADELLYNTANIEPAARKQMLRQVVSPLSRGEVRQIGASRADGEFRSADGQTVYRHALAEVQVPMLFLAGRADHLGTPDRVRAYYEAVGSPHKQLVIASRANGFAADYGHLDLGVGDDAIHDVYPRVAAWFEQWP
jgi:polyhydroxyalkanoate synthase